MDPLTILALLAGVGYLGKETALGGYGLYQQGKQFDKQMGLQELMAKYEQEGTKAANKENREMTDRYMRMLDHSQRRSDRQSSEDRQMQLIMAMMQGASGMQQNTVQTMANVGRPVPPMSMTALMRGL